MTGQRVATGSVYGAGFVTAFAAHAVAANIGVYAVGRHAALWQLGLLLAVYDGAEVVLKPVFGVAVDRRGAKAVMVGGLAAFAAASGLFALAGRPDWLELARFGQGCAAAAFSPAAGAAVVALGGRKRTGRLFGGYGGAKSVGYLIGPLGGGALVAAGGYRLLFAVTGCVAALAAAAASVWVPSTRPVARSRSSLADVWVRLRGRRFTHPVVVLAASAGSLSAGVGFLPLVGHRAHLGPVTTGAVVTLLAATAAVVQPLAGAAHDRGRLPPWSVRCALVVGAGGFVLGSLGGSLATLVAAAVLVGGSVGVLTPAGFALLAAAAPPGRVGTTLGAGEVGRELGDAGGPLVVGAVGQFGLAAGLLGMAGLLAAAAAVVGVPPLPADASSSGVPGRGGC